MLEQWLSQGKQDSLREIVGEVKLKCPLASTEKRIRGIGMNKSSLVKVIPSIPKKDKEKGKVLDIVKEMWNHVDLHFSSEDWMKLDSFVDNPLQNERVARRA